MHTQNPLFVSTQSLQSKSFYRRQGRKTPLPCIISGSWSSTHHHRRIKALYYTASRRDKTRELPSSSPSFKYEWSSCNRSWSEKETFKVGSHAEKRLMLDQGRKKGWREKEVKCVLLETASFLLLDTISVPLYFASCNSTKLILVWLSPRFCNHSKSSRVELGGNE